MKSLLINLHDRAEKLSGKNLVWFLIATFTIFMLIGFAGNYGIRQLLKSNEISEIPALPNTTDTGSESIHRGVVVYVNPQNYPGEGISYYLQNAEGQQTVLLKASDQTLQVVEGLFVEIVGQQLRTKDGKDVVLVERVIVNND